MLDAVAGGQWSVVGAEREAGANDVTRAGEAETGHRPLTADRCNSGQWPVVSGQPEAEVFEDASGSSGLATPAETGHRPLTTDHSPTPQNPPGSPTVQNANERRSVKPTLYFSQCFCPGCGSELKLSGQVALGDARPPNPGQAGPTWAAVRAELAALYSPPLARKATWAKHRQVLVEWAGRVASPAEIDAIAVAEWMADLARRKLRPATIKTLRATFAAQCQHFVSQGYLAASPFAASKKFAVKAGPKLDRHHSRDEIVRVLDRADCEWTNGYDRFSAGRLRALVYVVAMTGLRAREALTLGRADVDFARGIIHVGRNGDVKTEKSRRRVGMPDECATVLREWFDCCAGTEWVFPQRRHRDRPWTGGGTKTRPLGHVQALGQRAGVPGLSILNLRHSWATAGESLWQFSDTLIQRQMGHTNTTTQLGYRHSDVENLSAAVRPISYRRPALGIVDEQGNAKEAS